jgi:hypothetical protein
MPPNSSSLPRTSGLWACDPGDCDRPDRDGLLTIEARTILVHASGYDVTRVARWWDGSL